MSANGRGMHDDQARRPWLGLGVIVLVLFLLLAPLVLPIPTASVEDVGIGVAIAMVGVISGLLVARRPRHPISWLLASAAVAGGLSGLSAQALPPGLTDPTWWQMALTIISGPTWYLVLFSVLILVPLLFPTGSPPSPRWRWVGWVMGISTAVICLLWMTQESFCTAWSADGSCVAGLHNPIGISGIVSPEETALGGGIYVLLLIGAITALASLIVRFRRSGPMERQQLKWVTFSIGLFVGFTFVVELVWMDWLGQSEPFWFPLVQQLLWVAIPAAIAVAILRYRLYDIDRIVSRTVSYTLVGIVLAAVYAAGVIGVETLLPESGDLAIAASTLLVVALFSPLRRRVQRVVDRRFNRRRYDAEQVVDSFSGSLRDAVDQVVIAEDLRGVVTRTFEPVAASVWLRGD